MPSIHFVERLGNYHPIEKGSDIWESGFWVVSEDTATKLIGGQLFLHDNQDKPSRFGGEIISYRVHRGGTEDGRLIFKFRALPQCKGVLAGRDGWGNEKKIIW